MCIHCDNVLLFWSSGGGQFGGSEGEFGVLIIVYGVHTLVRTYYVFGERHTVTNYAVVVGQIKPLDTTKQISV